MGETKKRPAWTPNPGLGGKRDESRPSRRPHRPVEQPRVYIEEYPPLPENPPTPKDSEEKRGIVKIEPDGNEIKL